MTNVMFSLITSPAKQLLLRCQLVLWCDTRGHLLYCCRWRMRVVLSLANQVTWHVMVPSVLLR